jgi:hypothetical protein
LPHESDVMPLRLRLGAESIAVKVPARLSLVGLLLLLLLLLLPLARRVVRGLLLLLTTTVDAPGEQSTSVCLRVREHLSLVLLRCKNPLTLARVN